MNQREEFHRAIDAFDSASLSVVYEQVVALLKPMPPASLPESPPSLDEVLALTRASNDSWGDEVIEARNNRL